MQLYTISKEESQECFDIWKTQWNKYDKFQDNYFKEK